MPQNTQPGHFGADSPAYVFGRKNLDYQGPQAGSSTDIPKSPEDVASDFSSEAQKISADDLEYDEKSFSTPISNIDFSDVSGEFSYFEDDDSDQLVVTKDEDSGNIYATKYCLYGTYGGEFDDYTEGTSIKNDYPEVFNDPDKYDELKESFVKEYDSWANESLSYAAKGKDRDIIVERDWEGESEECFQYVIETTFSPGENGDYGGATFEDMLNSGSEVLGDGRYYQDGTAEFLRKEAKRISQS